MASVSLATASDQVRELASDRAVPSGAGARLCLAAAIASRRHLAIRSAPGARTTLRAHSIGHNSVTPSSAAFSTMKSIRGPLMTAVARISGRRPSAPAGAGLLRFARSRDCRRTFRCARDARRCPAPAARSSAPARKPHHVAHVMQLGAIDDRDSVRDDRMAQAKRGGRFIARRLCTRLPRLLTARGVREHHRGPSAVNPLVDQVQFGRVVRRHRGLASRVRMPPSTRCPPSGDEAFQVRRHRDRASCSGCSRRPDRIFLARARPAWWKSAIRLATPFSSAFSRALSSAIASTSIAVTFAHSEHRHRDREDSRAGADVDRAREFYALRNEFIDREQRAGSSSDDGRSRTPVRAAP